MSFKLQQFASIIILNVLLSLVNCNTDFNSQCYDSNGHPKKCVPDFSNAAYELKNIHVTNTCGTPPRKYCVQSNLHSSKNYRKRCDTCDSNDALRAHPIEYLTDNNDPTKLTWWQSETMAEGIQYPNSVNITLYLNKSYDITYIKINFHSPRPESFAIYKRISSKSDEWIPYQYYSASCQQTYGLPIKQYIRRRNEAIALCTDEFSDISPLTGASVAFSTLEGRPSAYEFDSSDELKEWVTATDIKIVLNRLNTFGDEIFSDDKVLRSYYYAISDISVGARCKCNGHAGRCDKENDQMKCYCKHNTNGTDCERCADFYNDLPWQPATDTNPFECKPCNCNGLSNECYFDKELFDSTGHGGHCINCAGNTKGEHCHLCKDGFYRREGELQCSDCECNPIGSLSNQCNANGQCSCKPGVRGDKCDHCEDYHYELSEDGCKMCTCDPKGSLDLASKCNHFDGQCECKQFVEGKDCDKCKFGHYNLEESNPQGCSSCFCFGHSRSCKSARNYVQSRIKTNDLNLNYLNLSNGNNALYDQSSDTIFIKHDPYLKTNYLYLTLPNEFNGDRHLSYNQELRFNMRLSKDVSLDLSRFDVLIDGAFSRKISLALVDNQEKVKPSTKWETFIFKISPESSWIPRERQREFMVLISNITAIKIRVNYGDADVFLNDISLGTAKLVGDSSETIDEVGHVEHCECPQGYSGLSCENCAFNYTRETPGIGPLSQCIPCSCNGHSITCDPNNGKCSCLHHTTGYYCDECEEGYYGNALGGTPNDCQKCPCPNDGPCIQLPNIQNPSKLDVVCTRCPSGTEGNLCERCSDGYYSVGPGKCEPCNCSNNVDPNEIGNCDALTGQCKKCIYNTSGFNCEKCLPAYWGNALTSLKCHACECDCDGSIDENHCDLSTGQCSCKPNVIGLQCDKCKDGYWNLISGLGCESCGCNVLGSLSLSCDQNDGTCKCKPGVTGIKCDQCMENYYGLNDDGCKKCNCDPFGSNSQQCDEMGRCDCRENYAGSKCNQCDENRYDFGNGCLKCPDCYNLVKNGVDKLKNRLYSLQEALGNVDNLNMNSDENKDLEMKIHALKINIDQLHDELYSKNGLKESFNATITHFLDQIKVISTNLMNNETFFNKVQFDFNKAKQIHDQINNKLDYLANTLKTLTDSIVDYQKTIDYLVENYEPSEKNKYLTELARTARQKAAEYTKITHEATELVESAIDQAENLLGFLINFIDQLPNINSTIGKHHVNINKIKEKINDLSIQSEDAKKYLRDQITLVEKAISKLQDSPSKDIQIDEDSVKQYLTNISKNIKDLKTEVDTIKSQISLEDYFELEQNLEDATKKFEKLNHLSDSLYLLKNQSEMLKNDGEKAINTTNYLYELANKMLDRLENFDEYVKEDKSEFLEKLQLIPEIQDHIKTSQKIQEKFEYSLNTNNLKDTPSAEMDLNSLHDKTEAIHNQAQKLKERTENLNEKFNQYPDPDDTKELYDSIENRYETALNKAENISSKTKVLMNEIDKSLDVLTSLDKSLEDMNFDSIVLLDINQLKDQFDRISIKINQTLQNNDIFENIELRNNILQKRISQAENQVNILEEKVEELDQLNRSLIYNTDGTKCFNTGQSGIEVSQQNGNSFNERKKQQRRKHKKSN